MRLPRRAGALERAGVRHAAARRRDALHLHARRPAVRRGARQPRSPRESRLPRGGGGHPLSAVELGLRGQCGHRLAHPPLPHDLPRPARAVARARGAVPGVPRRPQLPLRVRATWAWAGSRSRDGAPRSLRLAARARVRRGQPGGRAAHLDRRGDHRRHDGGRDRGRSHLPDPAAPGPTRHVPNRCAHRPLGRWRSELRPTGRRRRRPNPEYGYHPAHGSPDAGRGNGFPYIGTHPTNPNLVYAVWAEPGPGADDSDIRFSRSTDRRGHVVTVGAVTRT